MHLSTYHDRKPCTFSIVYKNTRNEHHVNTILPDTVCFRSAAARRQTTLTHCVKLELTNLGFCKVICNLPTCHDSKPCTRTPEKGFVNSATYINMFINKITTLDQCQAVFNI